MNEKHERDSFQELIDSIHVGDTPQKPAARPQEPVRVPIRRQDETTPGGNASGGQGVPVRRTDLPDQDEPLPRWLTEKKQPMREEAAQTQRSAPESRRPQPSAEPRQETVRQDTSRQRQQPADLSYREEPVQAPPVEEEPKKEPKRKRKKRIRKKYRVGRALLLTLLFLGLSVYLAYFAIRSFEDLTAVTLFGGEGAVERQMTVEIPEDATVAEIAEILYESGVVTEPMAFRLYTWVKQEEGFLGGEYIMTDKMDYDSIIYVLQVGDKRTDVVDIMFPEGSTTLDIAQRLEENGVCSANEFLSMLNRRDYNFTFVENIPENALRFYALEGYLFPNTHQFFVGESVESVINRFLMDFSTQITDDMRLRMNELNFTLDQTLVLASIIQKEANNLDEMRNISEVFHNRLNDSDTYPNLQSDPTIFYVEQVIKENIGMTNQAMYDAYNTYVCNGLPVGPICNPGIDAIEAALYPAQHEETYYYFVTDDEGKYYYAQTLEEHNYNIALADEVNERVAEEAATEAAAQAASSTAEG